jgi:hypothetical protein
MCVSTLKPAYAIDVFKPCGSAEAASSDICTSANKDKLFGPNGVWNKVLNIMTLAIGAVSVIVIIIGGLRYTLSAGDSSAITAAKNTIIYAAVGLVVASLGNAIVNFVLVNI